MWMYHVPHVFYEPWYLEGCLSLSQLVKSLQEDVQNVLYEPWYLEGCLYLSQLVSSLAHIGPLQLRLQRLNTHKEIHMEAHWHIYDIMISYMMNLLL